METDLVHTERGDVFTTSILVAKKLGVNHSDLLRTVDKIYKRWVEQYAGERSESAQKFTEATYVNRMNRTYRCYKMNEQAFIKVVMNLRGYEKAEIIQDIFIEEFYKMKRALLNHQNNSWTKKRSLSKTVRVTETDVIKDFIVYATEQGSMSANKYYMSITKMTNKALELLLQSEHSKNIRDLATATELGFISVVDDRARLAIQDGMSRGLPYKEIYRFAKDEVNTLVDSLDFKNKSLGVTKKV